MEEDIKKDLCSCDPVHAPEHEHDAHEDEKNGPGATGWVNPDTITGPGVKKES